LEDNDETDEERLIALMKTLGISNDVQFILLKQSKGVSLQQIARMLGKKYDTVQKQLYREKQRLAKKHYKTLRKPLFYL